MNGSLSHLRPASELAIGKPCGTRIKYMSGCKCVPCRAANSSYETERAAARRRGEWNGVVSAAKSRQHLLELSERGIGRDTVSDLTGLGVTMIDQIRSGKQKNLRAMNEKKILAIDPNSIVTDAQLVPARPTWKLIRSLLKDGFTKTDIARQLGYKTHALQIKQRGLITARTAAKVERLYNKLRPAKAGPSAKALDGVGEDRYIDLCTQCPLPDCIETSPQCLIQIERKKVRPTPITIYDSRLTIH